MIIRVKKKTHIIIVNFGYILIKILSNLSNLSNLRTFRTFQTFQTFQTLLLQPLVKPVEVHALPKHCILRMEYPVAFVGEV